MIGSWHGHLELDCNLVYVKNHVFVHKMLGGSSQLGYVVINHGDC